MKEEKGHYKYIESHCGYIAVPIYLWYLPNYLGDLQVDGSMSDDHRHLLHGLENIGPMAVKAHKNLCLFT